MGADPTGSANGTVPILKVRGLSREFRGFRAVDGVDLDVAEGSVHALVGPERRRQDHAVQPAHRLPRADRGQHRSSTAGTSPGSPPERVARLGVARSFQITSLFAAADRRASTWSWRCKRAPAWAGGSGAPTGRWPASPARADGTARPGRARPTHGGVPAGALAYGRKRALELALALALDPQGAAARRADRRHGRRGRRPHRRAHPQDPRGPHRGAGRAQHERGRPASPTGSPSCRPARCWSRARTPRSAHDPRVITAYLGDARC